VGRLVPAGPLGRDLPSLREKALRGGVAIHLLSFAVGLYALQVFARLMHYGDNQTLGGRRSIWPCSVFSHWSWD
jgi:hypothetical protein